MSGTGTNSSEGGWPAGWLIAAAAGFVGAIVARWLGDASFGTAVLFGLVVFIVFGVLLGMFWGVPAVAGSDEGHGAQSHHGHGHDGQGHSAPGHSAPGQAAMGHGHHDHAGTDHGHAPAAVTVAAPQPIAPLPEPVVQEAAVAPTPAEPLPEAAAPAEAAPVVSEPAAPVEAATPAPASTPEVVAAASVAASESRPVGLAAPRDGKGDDLQTLEGIGPAMEKLCHELGIFHLDQIASWGEAEVAWMDSNLKGFRGRVTRDKWVRQAALIGQVGIEEFKRRAKTNDY